MFRKLSIAVTSLLLALVAGTAAIAQPINQPLGALPVSDFTHDASVTSAATLIQQPTGGYPSFNFQFTAIGAGNSVRPQMSNDNSTWIDAICAQASNPNAAATTGAFAIASATSYSCSTSMKYFKMAVSTYGSGTVTMKGNFRYQRAMGTADVTAVVPAPTPDATVTGSATSAAVLSNFPVDASGYSIAGIQFTSIGAGNTVIVDGSADNTNWVSLITGITNSGGGNFPSQGLAISTATSYVTPLQYRYLRVRVSTYGSGTVTAVVTLKAQGNAPTFVTIGGNVASGAADSGNPAKTGGKYNLTRPTFTDGQRGDTQLDSRGNTGTAIYGADTATGANVVTPSDTQASTPGLVTESLNSIYDGSQFVRQRQITNGINSTGVGLPTEAGVAQCDDTSPAATTENSWGAMRLDCAGHALLVTGNHELVTDASSTITSGGVSQQAVASNSARKFLMCQNIDTANVEDLWLNIGVAAAANTAGSIRIQSGASITFDSNYIPTNAINVVAATTGHRYTCKTA